MGMKYDTTDAEQARPSAMRALDADFDHEQALRWSLTLAGVSLAVVGMYTAEELQRNIEWVRRLQPLSQEEQQALLARGRSFSTDWGAHYGDIE
jgi:aryl-alcohol dehydrogenase-like predicted oxidoreductase